MFWPRRRRQRIRIRQDRLAVGAVAGTFNPAGGARRNDPHLPTPPQRPSRSRPKTAMGANAQNGIPVRTCGAAQCEVNVEQLILTSQRPRAYHKDGTFGSLAIRRFVTCPWSVAIRPAGSELTRRGGCARVGRWTLPRLGDVSSAEAVAICAVRKRKPDGTSRDARRHHNATSHCREPKIAMKSRLVQHLAGDVAGDKRVSSRHGAGESVQFSVFSFQRAVVGWELTARSVSTLVLCLSTSQPSSLRAWRNTASNMGSVRRPVKVFCWLGW